MGPNFCCEATLGAFKHGECRQLATIAALRVKSQSLLRLDDAAGSGNVESPTGEESVELLLTDRIQKFAFRISNVVNLRNVKHEHDIHPIQFEIGKTPELCELISQNLLDSRVTTDG